MAIGFGPVQGKTQVTSKYTVVRADGTVVAECKTRQEAEQQKVAITQALNCGEELTIKELKLL